MTEKEGLSARPRNFQRGLCDIGCDEHLGERVWKTSQAELSPLPGRADIKLPPHAEALLEQAKKLKKQAQKSDDAKAQVRLALYNKKKAKERYDDAFKYVVGVVRNYFLLAGYPEVARYLKPYPKRQSVPKGVVDEQQPPVVAPPDDDPNVMILDVDGEPSRLQSGMARRF